MKFIKENLRVFIAVLIAVILIAIGVILILINGDHENDITKDQIMKEEELVEITGMSGNDAIEVVKQNFHGNNYEFSVEITSDSLYKVKAVSKTSDSEIIYFVDPINGKAYVDIDTN